MLLCQMWIFLDTFSGFDLADVFSAQIFIADILEKIGNLKNRKRNSKYIFFSENV